MTPSSSAGNLPHRAGVLITGCSSGIGRAIAIHLSSNGFTVFATVRKEADAEALRKISNSNLVPLCPLDLTKVEQIPPIVDAVDRELTLRGTKGLFALINNAGGGGPAPLELMDLATFRIELETRVLGSVALVQAFLPMIREAQGRILWITTPATIPTPFVTGIHACDFAVNCIARTLEFELRPWKIANVMIRCGGIRTPAGLRTTSDVQGIIRDSPPDRARLYERALRIWSDEMTRFDKKRTEPEKVADIVLKALIAKTPKRRYTVGHLARAAAVLELLPQTMTDRVLELRF